MSATSGGQCRKDVGLDDLASFRHLDPENMLDFAAAFPLQLKHAAAIGRAQKIFTSPFLPSQIVLAGMGGSAIAGDLLARLSESSLSIPFLVCRDYNIPRFVGSKTLFIASSHSGNTEETLSAVAVALRRGAKIVCVTTGGKLWEFARSRMDRGVSLLEIPQTNPPMPPRAAICYSLIPVLYLLGSLGLYRGVDRQVREAMALLSELRDIIRPENPTRDNPAKQLAIDLRDKLVWIHGTAGIMSAVAYRWRCQFNENSKSLACTAEYPELTHNEVTAWDRAQELANHIAIILLCRPDEHGRTSSRANITIQDIIGRRVKVHVIEARGASPLAQMLWAIYLGDYTSLYLAFLRGVNPAAIEPIHLLKKKLAELDRPSK